MTVWQLSLPAFDVQKKAVVMSYYKRGWAHFLEQGLGKTAVIYNEWLSHLKLVNCMTIITPTSLVKNWVNEAEKFGINDEIITWSSSRSVLLSKEITHLIKSTKRFIVVVNYESTNTSAKKILELIVKQRNVLLVADESIHLKNPSSVRAKIIRELSKSAVLRRALSGAPVTQGVQDLWGQLKFIGVLEGSNFYAFRNRYCVMGGFQGKKVIRQRTDTADELTKILSQCSFRAEKKDWTNIPSKLYTTRSSEMTGPQLRIYNEMRNDFVAIINNKEITADLIITKLMKLQQISSGFIIDENKTINSIVEDKHNPKLNMLLEIIEETTNKILVFVYHKEAVEMLKRNLNSNNTAFLTGGQSVSEIEMEKIRFNSDDDVNTMVCQINAAMYGHTLLGTNIKPCHTTVFFENVYSLNARVQAEDRNHRHGQTNNVLYVDLITSKLDSVIIKALKSKQNVAESVMTNLKEYLQ